MYNIRVYQILHLIPFRHQLIVLLVSFFLQLLITELATFSLWSSRLPNVLTTLQTASRGPAVHLYSCTSLAHLEGFPHITPWELVQSDCFSPVHIYQRKYPRFLKYIVLGLPVLVSLLMTLTDQKHKWSTVVQYFKSYWKKKFFQTSLDLKHPELLFKYACLSPWIAQSVRPTSKHDESRSFHPL